MSNHEREGPSSRGEGATQDANRDTAQDTRMRRAWQQASDEQPPPELDAAIIAAARESVQDRGARARAIDTGARSRNRWMQWQPLAAAASVAGLAFILVQLMPRDREAAPSIRMEEPAPRAATMEDKAGATAPAAAVTPSAAAVPQAKNEALDYDAAAKAEAPAASTEEALDESVAEAPVASTADSKAAMRATETDQREAVASGMAGPAAPAAAAAPARARNAGNAATPDAAARAARIAALYTSGDAIGAADELRAFRAVDPDADKYLPDSLRDWALTVR